MTILSVLATAIDTQGWIITIVGWLIVLVALILLSAIFSSIPKIINYYTIRKLKREGKKYKDDDFSIDGDVNAAIATALHLHFQEMHDDESNIITIKKVAKRYSPWSSKIYNMNTYFNRYRN